MSKAQDLQDKIAALREAQTLWAAHPAAERLARLDRVARSWIHQAPPQDLQDIAQACGMSLPMVTWGLSTTCQAWCQGAEDLLQRAAGGLQALDDGWAHPARVSGHVWASTLPSSGWIPVLGTLALGGAVLIKAPEAVCASALALQRSLTRVCPALGACVEVMAWRGGGEEDEALVVACDALVVSGGAEAISRFALLIAQQAPRRVPWLPFGPGLSLCVGMAGTWEDLSPDTARGVALDLVAYDQRGCLSPQALWLEGSDRDQALAFCQHLARAVTLAAQTLPRGPLPEAISAAIMQRKSTTLFTGQVVAAQDALILLEPEAYRYDNPLHRTLPVHLFQAGPQGLDRALSPYGRLQSVALLGQDTPGRRLRSVLASRGVNRLCAPGTMQTPPATWHHDGMAWLSQLLHFIDGA